MATPEESGRERDPLIAALEAGLDIAVRQFPEDVAAAARIATQCKRAMPDLDDVTTEPWPPMHVRKTP